MNQQLQLEQFWRLRDFIYQKTGIYFPDNKLYYVERRLLDRMEALNLPSVAEYYTYLRFERQNEEFQTFIEALTVNETYFFREFHQLKCFAEELLPELIRQNKNEYVFWSAGCSTGEEAYTLAIILYEMLGPETLSKCRILATDIDNKVLAFARRGVYGERSFKHIPKPYLQRYFERIGTEYRVGDKLRKLVQFQQLNLIDTKSMQQVVDIAAIFCRNVLIYFDDVSRRQVAFDFYQSLRTGGYIVLGVSESMSRITTLFQLRKYQHAIVYQKAK
jgi:chemotaxis protein methyltransferase CheR